MQQSQAVRSKGGPWAVSFVRPVAVVVGSFYAALALSNLALIVGPAMAQGIEVPWAPVLGTMWNPAELMPDASWLVWAVLSVALQIVAVLRGPPLRWLALAASAPCAIAMGDFARWTGPYLPLAAVLALIVATAPALIAVWVSREASP